MTPDEPHPEQPVWHPSPQRVQASNINWLMQQVGVSTYAELHRWSVNQRADYWQMAVERLDIQLRKPDEQMLDLSCGVEQPRWMVGAEWNTAENCLAGPVDAPAIVSQREHGPLETMTIGQLDALSNRVAAGLDDAGIRPGDAVATVMPMTANAVAAYLGILKCGAVAVGIAESFSAEEIAVRLRLGRAKKVLVQDEIRRGERKHELYTKMRSIDRPPCVVLPADEANPSPLDDGDVAWSDFLSDRTSFASVACGPDDPIGVLFSSGTTGEPKAIPWTNLCAIKCAADAHFHHDTHPGDVLAWPTSMGWMMGPWLVLASLLNRGCMALYDGLPTTSEFATFVQQAGVRMLGVVPSLIAAWRAGRSLEDVDWSGIQVFSSTGECSNPEDVRWLLEQAGGRPMIEYCGGTEIAGGYITGTVVRPCIAATFNTPALGVDVVILDEAGRPAEQGELYLVPPSIGLSTTLLNRDHHDVYYAGCPRGPQGEVLRRHGDEMQRLPGGYWRAHGRVDDTMNLSGIKVSSAEIERCLRDVSGVRDLAAVAETPPGGGPSQLILFAVPGAEGDAERLRVAMQRVLRERLNPLFRIERVELVDALPRTASNKVMRRRLRSQSND